MLVLFTGFMSSLSILYNRRELAIIALVGGFIAPFLVGSGDGSYWVLFTYVMILDLGMFGLSIYKKWGIACNLFCLDLDRLCGLYVCYGSGFDGKCPINAFTYFLYRLLFDLLIIGRFHRANQYPGINQYLLGVIGLNNFVFLFFALCLLQNMELERNYKGLVTLLLRLLTSLFSFGSNGKGNLSLS